MKVKVLKEFIDKNTRELHTVGSSFSCDENRLKEIQKAGDFVEVVPERKKEAKASEE